MTTVDHSLEISNYDYDLPEDRIAQEGVEPRDSARLMVLDRKHQSTAISTVRQIPEFLRRGDCLVLNDTRVGRCRLRGRIGERSVEILTVRWEESSAQEWRVDAMVYPGKRFSPGVRVDLGPELSAWVEGMSDIGRWIIFNSSDGRTPIRDILDRIGEVALPPYVTNRAIAPDRYQTCYARQSGSVAAPTAGLHFTPELFNRLTQTGISSAFLTLHVGPGTFRPVTARQMETGELHPEWYCLPEGAASAIKAARDRGGRIVVVGTTVCRTLEWIQSRRGGVEADSGMTNLFIRDGFEFRVTDSLLTNFHLPRTSLLMLVCALAGREFVLDAYQRAIEEKFRFYSFGDAMLIL